MNESDPSYAKIMEYIDRTPAAVLGTLGDDGPHGAVVFAVTASHGTVCFVTKNQTRKYADVTKHPEVSLTLFSEKDGTTLQIKGRAFIAEDTGMKNYVMEKVSKAHTVMSDWQPPVTRVDAGEYAVVGVEILYARLTDYEGLGINGPDVIEYIKEGSANGQ